MKSVIAVALTIGVRKH